jgi:hypothetical protein
MKYLLINFLCFFIFIYTILIPLSCVKKANKSSSLLKCSAAASSIVKQTHYQWSHSEKAHFNIHYLAEKWSATRVDSLGNNLEIYYQNNLKILGDTTYNKKVDVFFVGPKSDVGTLGGSATTACALIRERALFFSNIKRSTYPAIMQHELMHVLSWQIWGTAKDHFIVEGLATYAYGASMCDYDFHALASYCLSIGKLPSLHDFIYKYDSFDELTNYMSGGSFLKKIEQEYGHQALRKVWEQGIEKGLVELGTTVTEFDKKWRKKLSEIKPATEHDWKFIDNGCSDSSKADQ